MKKTFYIGLGCFWGIQKFFDNIPGVTSTFVGYAGGADPKHPTYQNIGDYTEAVKVTYDSTLTDITKIFKTLFTHKSLTYSTVGQYMYAYWYQDADEQEQINTLLRAEEKRTRMEISLKLLPHTHFELGEEYHQKYFEKQGGGHCSL